LNPAAIGSADFAVRQPQESAMPFPFVHPLSDVQSDAIGTGTRIWQFCVVLPGARIGRDCNVNAQCLIENDVVVGDRVTVKPGVQLWDGLRIEDDVFIGPNVTFTNDKYPRSRRPPPQFAQTRLRRGASIGANATLVCGVEIGAGAMIGAGSVVTRDVPAGELWYGNPARCHGPAPRSAETSGMAGSVAHDAQEPHRNPE
jgi:UDP-2-acetamido-3-amino-2,3-dideoxy-glucuronate N-acetyltransferase